MKNISKPLKTSDITLGGITIGLTMVSFMLFKGITNIFNALIIPLLLYACISRQSKKAMVITFSAFLLLCGLFFKPQLFFSIFYIALAILLAYLTRAKLRLPLRALALSGAAFVSFILAIRLTDIVLLTRIELIMLSLVQGSLPAYLGIIFLQGAFAGTSLALLSKIIDKKLTLG